MIKNTANTLKVFAFDRDTAIPKTGDASNITCKVSLNGGALVSIADTNPTELEDGYYLFNITAAESNGVTADFFPESSTSKIQVICVEHSRYLFLGDVNGSVNANIVSANGLPVLAGDFNFAVSAGGRMVNDVLELVPGDEYQEADDTAITFTDSRFPDLDLFTSSQLTVYVAGTPVVDHVAGSAMNDATKTVTVELTEAQTTLLLDYIGYDATFDLELVRADGTRKTVARGPANILDPLG